MNNPLDKRSHRTGISHNAKSPRLGFTLIELMVAMAIAATLVAIAVPSYQAHIRKTYRDLVQSDLMLFADAMHKAARLKFTYEGQATSGNTGAPKTAVFPALAPLQNNNKLYNLTIDSANADYFLLKATPQSQGMMVNDGRLTIDSRGKRCWYKNSDATGGTCTPW
jgi:type IV pilus assembly protein PilE